VWLRFSASVVLRALGGAQTGDVSRPASDASSACDEMLVLSLAHSQLGAVFHDRVLMMTIGLNNPLAMMIGE
jgi:hypothetical protein